MNNNFEGAWKVVELHNKFVQADINRWLKTEFFTIQWWILAGILIIPWLIWVKLSNKNQLFETILIGSLSLMVITAIDILGFDLNFWFYPTELIPFGVFCCE